MSIVLLASGVVPGQSIWVEAERALASEGGVRGAGSAVRVPSAWGGHCLRASGDAEGDGIRWWVTVTEPIPDAVLRIRGAECLGPAEFVVEIDGAPRGLVRFDANDVHAKSSHGRMGYAGPGRMPWREIPLGALAAGTRTLQLVPTESEGVWLDALVIHPKGHVPAIVQRELMGSNADSGGTTHVFCSPGVAERTMAAMAELLARFESVGSVVASCCYPKPWFWHVVAATDARPGAAELDGFQLCVHEGEAMDPKSVGILARRMARRCLEMEGTWPPHRPAWLLRGCALSVGWLAEQQMLGESPEPAGALDAEAGMWRAVFRIEPKLFVGLVDRLTDVERNGPIWDPANRRDARLAERAYADLLFGAASTSQAREIFDSWRSLPPAPKDALPQRGETVIQVRCGAGSPAGAHEWRPEFDLARRKRGFAYRTDVEAFRDGDAHWRVRGDGHTLDFDVPASFEGSLRIQFGRRVSLELGLDDGRLAPVEGESELVLPVRAASTADGQFSVALPSVGDGYRILAVELCGPPDLGARVLDVECSETTPRDGENFEWQKGYDTATVVEGFDYELLVGQAWRHGDHRQWFGHDPRYGEQPLEFEVRVPKGFDGVLRLTPDDEGRIATVLVENRRYRLRMGMPLAIPISRAEDDESPIRVVMRKVRGMNCALRRLEVLRAR